MEEELKNEGINVQTMLVPDVYEPLFEKDYNKFLFASGRISGKTSSMKMKWYTTVLDYPDCDCVINQATTVELKDSFRTEIISFLRKSGFDVGDSPTNEWYAPKSGEFIQQRGAIGKTYFKPISDSTGGQRTRGIKTENPVALVIFEEVQKNKDRNVVEQAIITFMRQLANDQEADIAKGKKRVTPTIIITGNNETIGHWFVDFVEEYREKKDENGKPEWCYVHATCSDIWNLLNEETRKFILSYKRSNPIEFKRIFLGDIHASTSDVVFPQFNRNKHYKTKEELAKEKKFFDQIIIGIDHATANDTFAVAPVAILNDGTCLCLERCYDDPEETNRTLAPTEQCELLEDFLEWLDKEYGLVYNYVKVALSVDGASSPFIAQLRHTKRTSRNQKLWRNINIYAFTQKRKDVNMGIIKNAFAYNVLSILNEGEKNWRGEKNKHRLAHEIEAQRYNKVHKLDEKIKNDLVDALEYGLIPFYSNCYNLSFPRRNEHFNEIKKSAGMK